MAKVLGVSGVRLDEQLYDLVLCPNGWIEMGRVVVISMMRSFEAGEQAYC